MIYVNHFRPISPVKENEYLDLEAFNNIIKKFAISGANPEESWFLDNKIKKYHKYKYDLDQYFSYKNKKKGIVEIQIPQKTNKKVETLVCKNKDKWDNLKNNNILSALESNKKSFFDYAEKVSEIQLSYIDISKNIPFTDKLIIVYVLTRLFYPEVTFQFRFIENNNFFGNIKYSDEVYMNKVFCLQSIVKAVIYHFDGDPKIIRKNIILKPILKNKKNPYFETEMKNIKNADNYSAGKSCYQTVPNSVNIYGWLSLKNFINLVSDYKEYITKEKSEIQEYLNLIEKYKIVFKDYQYMLKKILNYRRFYKIEKEGLSANGGADKYLTEINDIKNGKKILNLEPRLLDGKQFKQYLSLIKNIDREIDMVSVCNLKIPEFILEDSDIPAKILKNIIYSYIDNIVLNKHKEYIFLYLFNKYTNKNENLQYMSQDQALALKMNKEEKLYLCQYNMEKIVKLNKKYNNLIWKIETVILEFFKKRRLSQFMKPEYLNYLEYFEEPLDQETKYIRFTMAINSKSEVVFISEEINTEQKLKIIKDGKNQIIIDSFSTTIQSEAKYREDEIKIMKKWKNIIDSKNDLIQTITKNRFFFSNNNYGNLKLKIKNHDYIFNNLTKIYDLFSKLELNGGGGESLTLGSGPYLNYNELLSSNKISYQIKYSLFKLLYWNQKNFEKRHILELSNGFMTRSPEESITIKNSHQSNDGLNEVVEILKKDMNFKKINTKILSTKSSIKSTEMISNIALLGVPYLFPSEDFRSIKGVLSEAFIKYKIYWNNLIKDENKNPKEVQTKVKFKETVQYKYFIYRNNFLKQKEKSCSISFLDNIITNNNVDFIQIQPLPDMLFYKTKKIKQIYQHDQTSFAQMILNKYFHINSGLVIFEKILKEESVKITIEKYNMVISELTGTKEKIITVPKCNNVDLLNVYSRKLDQSITDHKNNVFYFFTEKKINFEPKEKIESNRTIRLLRSRIKNNFDFYQV